MVQITATLRHTLNAVKDSTLSHFVSNFLEGFNRAQVETPHADRLQSILNCVKPEKVFCMTTQLLQQAFYQF